MTKKTTRTRAEAKRLMWEYYRDNSNRLPRGIRAFREDILNYIGSGMSTHDAFCRMLKLWSDAQR
jgi:hypothetical protein